MKLKELANVRSGLILARKQSKIPSHYRYPLLNLKCIHPDGYILKEQLEVFHAVEYLNLEYVTHRGDIVVRLSTPYTAVLIDEATEGLVIPSSFAIIRTDSRKILPDYLQWLLNTQRVKQHIFESATGNMLAAVKPSYFADFELKLISMENQQTIARLHGLMQKETQLLHRLAEEKEKYYNFVIEDIQKSMK